MRQEPLPHISASSELVPPKPAKMSEEKVHRFARALLRSYHGRQFEFNDPDVWHFKLIVCALAEMGCVISWDYERAIAIVTPRSVPPFD